MSRTLYVIVDLTVPDKVDDEAVADYVDTVLREVDDDNAQYETVDGTEWRRPPE